MNKRQQVYSEPKVIRMQTYLQSQGFGNVGAIQAADFIIYQTDKAIKSVDFNIRKYCLVWSLIKAGFTPLNESYILNDKLMNMPHGLEFCLDVALSPVISYLQK